MEPEYEHIVQQDISPNPTNLDMHRIGMLKNGLFLLAHGTTPTEEIPESDYRFMFKCPPNIRIVSFEYPGHSFNHYDAGYIYNYIHQRIAIDGQDIDLLNESRVTIPIDKIKMSEEDDTRSYYCRVYHPDDEVPNICLKFEDNYTQTGIYDMYNSKSNTVPFGAFLSKMDESRNPVYYLQLDTNLLSRDIIINRGLLGTVILKNNILNISNPIYSKPDTNLEKVVNEVNNIKNELTTIYIVSCRVFTSKYRENMNSYLVEAENVYNQTVKNYNTLVSGYENIYKHICETIPEVCNKDDFMNYIKNLHGLKMTLDGDMARLITGLADMVNKSNADYENLKELLNNYLFKDYTNNKKEVVLPTGDNMFRYLFVNKEKNTPFYNYLLNTKRIPNPMIIGGGIKVKNIDYYYNMIDNGENINNVIKKLKNDYKA